MDNILIIDKPKGLTSHDVIDLVRKRLKVKKAGHCGTLDPMATGVLVVLLNKATKLSSQFSADDKEYLCTMTLGATTDTQDSTGKVLKEAGLDGIDDDRIKEAIMSFKGKQEQIPPMVSAKLHKGKRLYKLARKGIEVERSPQQIEIKEIEIVGISKPEAEFKVTCSKGTYIRTLCHDIGEKLGCGAHMSALRRMRSGKFHIDDAISAEDIR
ncbi:MAG: tRNA pseudouridine(55) synthase TruB [Candidatus Omnitrophica bacterium]|nr:tRNA pseudouridine(55) synthase TruB [Candidatus Omnitrophota bacterium]